MCVCVASRGREKRTSVSSSAGGMRFLCTGVEAIRQSSKGRGRCRKSIFRKGFLHSVHLREEKVSCIVLLLLLRLKYLSLPAEKRFFAATSPKRILPLTLAFFPQFISAESIVVDPPLALYCQQQATPPVWTVNQGGERERESGAFSSS